MADQTRSVTADQADQNAGIVEAGRRVIRTEAAALNALADSLDDDFGKAVRIVLATTGRVIITGMGKSGHVARKIAATMASTGTPAYFVHPGEASHGDLGMLRPDDTLICLSNSGETSELADILGFAALNRIKVIAMVGRDGSTMGERADVALVTPRYAEACPNGLAPTTSTTMMLALGDALAVSLLEQRSFTEADFRRFHPGGKLGAKLLLADDLMHKGENLPLVATGTGLSDALLVMTGKSLGCVGVTDGAGNLLGLITDGDLRRGMNDHDNLLACSVDQIMTTTPETIPEGTMAAEGVGIMNSKKITSLFVMRSTVPVGLLHLHDCIRTGVA